MDLLLSVCSKFSHESRFHGQMTLVAKQILKSFQVYSMALSDPYVLVPSVKNAWKVFDCIAVFRVELNSKRLFLPVIRMNMKKGVFSLLTFKYVAFRQFRLGHFVHNHSTDVS